MGYLVLGGLGLVVLYQSGALRNLFSSAPGSRTSDNTVGPTRQPIPAPQANQPPAPNGSGTTAGTNAAAGSSGSDWFNGILGLGGSLLGRAIDSYGTSSGPTSGGGTDQPPYDNSYDPDLRGDYGSGGYGDQGPTQDFSDGASGSTGADDGGNVMDPEWY